jgi:hypothetical protein
MANLLAHFEPSELVDFMNFIGLLIHKLQVRLMPIYLYSSHLQWDVEGYV